MTARCLLTCAIGAAAVQLAPVRAITSMPDTWSASVAANRRTRGHAAASAAVEDLVRQALQDRFGADDIPDLALLEDRSHVLLSSELRRARLQLTARALPRIEGTRFALIGVADAQALADRSHHDVVSLTVDDPAIEGDRASLWIGTDLTIPSQKGVVRMCCCEGRGDFKKMDGRWIFVKWALTRCS